MRTGWKKITERQMGQIPEGRISTWINSALILRPLGGHQGILKFSIAQNPMPPTFYWTFPQFSEWLHFPPIMWMPHGWLSPAEEWGWRSGENQNHSDENHYAVLVGWLATSPNSLNPSKNNVKCRMIYKSNLSSSSIYLCVPHVLKVVKLQWI